MLSVLRSGALQGIDAAPVTVEVDIAFGLPGFSLVGLPDSAVKEARERVFSSLKNSGYEVPSRRVTINLAPADLRKEGSALDLPMALGMLAASEQIDPALLDGVMAMGELSLDGGLRPARGILSMALAARRQGLHSVLLPAANAREAALVPGIRLLPAASLKGALEALRTGRGDPIPEETEVDLSGADPDLDYSEIKGHAQAKRALEVAAAGGHNFLMAGSPGCGKTLMARRLPSILPPLSEEEGLEATRIYSVAGLLRPGHGILRRRPFRAPHHSISDQALVGGGKIPRPGEVSLAHLGVLFLDELPEFRKSTLETLRQPLEDGQVTIARTAHTVTYPSRCLLGAAMNPWDSVALLFLTPVTLKARKSREPAFVPRHIGDHIRLCRFLRKLTPDIAAGQIGTKKRNLMLWEQGSSGPLLETIPGILRFLGYDPYPPPLTTLPERMFAARRCLGLYPMQMAIRFGVNERTWRDWELGHHKPYQRRVEALERLLADAQTEAKRGWPGKPPEGSIPVPASFKFLEGRAVPVRFR